jgi:hypothetical protein
VGPWTATLGAIRLNPSPFSHAAPTRAPAFRSPWLSSSHVGSSLRQSFPLAHFHKRARGLLACSSLHVNSLRLGARLHHCSLLARLGPPHWPAPGRAQMFGSATANTPPSHPEAGFFIYDHVFPSGDPFSRSPLSSKTSFPVLSPSPFSQSLASNTLAQQSLVKT